MTARKKPKAECSSSTAVWATASGSSSGASLVARRAATARRACGPGSSRTVCGARPLLVYMAESAAKSSASRVVPSVGKVAMPKETPWWWATRSMASAARRAMRAAASRSARGRTSANSSPPMRKAESVVRQAAATAPAVARRVRSPAAWPPRSLTDLKRSRSKMTTESASGGVARSARCRCASSASWNSRWLSSPVSGSRRARASCSAMVNRLSRTSAACSAKVAMARRCRLRRARDGRGGLQVADRLAAGDQREDRLRRPIRPGSQLQLRLQPGEELHGPPLHDGSALLDARRGRDIGHRGHQTGRTTSARHATGWSAAHRRFCWDQRSTARWPCSRLPRPPSQRLPSAAYRHRSSAGRALHS